MRMFVRGRRRSYPDWSQEASEAEGHFDEHAIAMSPVRRKTVSRTVSQLGKSNLS